MFNFSIPVPTDAQHAVRQANRHERALRLIEDGCSFLFDELTETVDVVKPRRLATEYIIHLNPANSMSGKAGCDCADMVKTGEPCKHFLAAAIVADRRKEEERDAEQCAAYEATRARAGVHESLLPDWYGG